MMTEGQRKYQFMLKMAAWQRRKSEIMRRDDFSCCECGRTGTVILNVHHKTYGFDKMPWEYDDEELETLCLKCHKDKHAPLGVLVGPKIDRRPEVVKQMDVQIEDLKQGLLKNPTHEQMEEILKKIMFLRTERKTLIKY